MKHEQTAVGEPCRRCGIPCIRETSGVPCFEEGDTFETWKARQPAEIFKVLYKPPAIHIDIDSAKKAFSQMLMHLLKLKDPHPSVVDAAADSLSTLIAVHLQNAKIETERVRELEAPRSPI